MNNVKIDIKMLNDAYWHLRLDDGTSFMDIKLNHGEMVELAKSIPFEFIKKLWDWKTVTNSKDGMEYLLSQIADCEYCGDCIPKDQMEEHVAWCKPMIEGNKK